MFRSLRLIDAFEHLASPSEWHWFGPMVARGTSHFGVDGWPLFSFGERQAYDGLYKELHERALDKLRRGDWIAEGICASRSPQRMQVDTYLWDYLQFVHRMEEAKGAGFHFIALTVTDTQPPKVVVSQANTAMLRTQLTAWIRAQGESASKPILRSEQLAMARAVFPDVVITDNMYRECRRAAGLSLASVQTGRPKTKGCGK